MSDDFLADTLTLSKALISRFEGCAAKEPQTGLYVPYLCPAGYWTIGYGRLVPRDHPPITAGEALVFLTSDVLRHMGYVLDLSPNAANSSYRLAALTSFVFNLGPGAYKASTLRRYVDAQEWDAAAGQFSRWVNGGGKPLKGLILRREAERVLFNGSGSA